MPLDWFDGSVQLTFEVALSGATSTYGTWDDALWDSATWGPGDEWEDLSSRLRRGIATSRGFSREVQVWDPGTATVVLDNNDGNLSPSNLAGLYVSAGVTQIRPGRGARLTATYDGVTYPLWTGRVDAWREGWEPGTDVAIVTVPGRDEMARLARFDGYETTAQGAGELSGSRIHRILDNAGHTGERRVDEGVTTLQATTLAANAVGELKLTADSEGGALYIDADGAVVFEQRYALLENTRSNTVQTIFGDGSGGVDEIPCADQSVAYDDELIINMVSFARTSGTAQHAADLTSRALYEDRRDTRTNLVCETDAQVLELAQWHIARLRDPEQRFTSVKVKPRTNPTVMFPVVLGLKVRDLVRVIRRAPGGHTISHLCFIAGIAHDISKDDWETTFELSSATVYAAFTSSLWDTGRWDEARWSF